MSSGDVSEPTMKRYDFLSHEFDRLGGYELERLRDTVANGLGIPRAQRDQLFSELSGGERTRMNLARLILEDTDILLLDEPTNHLDMSAVAWLENYISHFRGTVLAISHGRWFLDRAVSRIIEITGGRAEFYPGSYSFYVEEKRRRYQEKLKQYEKEQSKIAQLRKAADDLHLWAFMGNDKLHKRAFSIEKRIEKMETVDKPQTEERMKARFSETEFRADEVLLVKNAAKSFGDRKLFSGVDLLMRGGERVALIGDNGTGKSTFIKLIMNEESPDEGLIRLGPAVKTAYLPQIVSFQDENLTVLETMMYEAKLQMGDARDRLGAYMFRGDDVFTKVSQLSGGEKSRLKLAIIMRSNLNLLILDEPTNHLDIAMREWVEDALSDYSEALLFVSHDRYFISKFATRIWELRDGKLFDYQCGYERYLELKEREASPALKKAKEEPALKPQKEKRTSQFTKEKQLARLEREIADIEKKLDENEKAQEENASDYEKLLELGIEWDALHNQLSEKYMEWESFAN
ncbi:MAG: ABC-F family ATP-binding cassette domain-containing protein, partial [Oscillospiraceae bacterium]|nr:ABC-F family ATP-binding cassette domain-containing protein [Oscillospiraceae bacterium]